MSAVYVLSITLKFTQTTSLPFFHQAVLTAFLRTLLVNSPDYEKYCRLDAPESGRTAYRVGDEYHFVLFVLPQGLALAQRLLSALQALPDSFGLDQDLALGKNLRFVQAQDFFQQQAIDVIADLMPYHPQTELKHWQSQSRLLIRLRSPVRLLLDKNQRQHQKGEKRYCRQPQDLSADLIQQRLYKSVETLQCNVCTQCNVSTQCNIATQHFDADTTFWIDYAYRHADGKVQPMGGLLGLITIDCSQFTDEQWLAWVLGQYVGIGQRRAFGWGRYQLEDETGKTTALLPQANNSLIKPITALDNLSTAYQIILNNSNNPNNALSEPIERLQTLAQQLQNGQYRIPKLHGVIQDKDDGYLRPLAIPPFLDRVAQRAVAQVISQGLDSLMYQQSYGFRQGRSRQQVRLQIKQAYADGYRWLYKADIHSFFDSVTWTALAVRLRALFGDDPVVDLILAWMSAPVKYAGETIQRGAGLPQGSPLSPLLANLILDDFDSDLDKAGFKLIRFADDFVVLCKSEKRAQQAAKAAKTSLAQVGLAVNVEKTRITTFEQGFHYLGYLFINGMVLESKATSNHLPTQSWLAQFEQQQLQAIEEKQTTTKITTAGHAPDTGTVLYVTGAPAYLSTAEGRLFVKREAADKSPAINVDKSWQQLRSVVLIGNHNISTATLRAAFKQQVPIHFASRGGQYQGVAWHGTVTANQKQLQLRQQQLFADEEKMLAVARLLVASRLRSQAEVLRLRDVKRRFKGYREQLKTLIKQVKDSQSLTQLNGYEGQGAKIYFAALQLIVPEPFKFTGRNRRPPQDPFNALLSLGYTILHNQTECVIQVNHLLPWLGIYHQGHGNHATLASDLIEPFRYLVERCALNVLNKRQLEEKDFYFSEENGCRLHSQALKVYLQQLSVMFETPFIGLDYPDELTLLDHQQQQIQNLLDWIDARNAEFNPWRLR